MSELELLERGTVKEANEHGLVVVVDDIELYVSPRVKRRACTCCGDETYLDVSYNRSMDGDDPLNINGNGI